MYFSTEPKTKRGDLFDFERESKELLRAIRDKTVRMIAIIGLRRTGKTSLLRVVLNTIDNPKVLIDAHEIFPLTQTNIALHVTSKLKEELSKYKFFGKVLGKIREIEVLGIRAYIERPQASLSEILEEINRTTKKQFLFVLDEVQVLKKSKFDRFLAYVYDTLPNIKIIVAGSEVGLLSKFLGEEPKAPLYGRAFISIKTEPLAKEKAIQFLKLGFRQVKMAVKEEELSKAISSFNGIIGWLAYFGWHSWKAKSIEVGAKQTIKVGTKIALDEFNNFLTTRGIAARRYRLIAQLLAVEPSKWSSIKNWLGSKEGKEIPNKQLSSYLSALMEYGFITKKDGKYHITDPLLAAALKMR